MPHHSMTNGRRRYLIASCLRAQALRVLNSSNGDYRHTSNRPIVSGVKYQAIHQGVIMSERSRASQDQQAIDDVALGQKLVIYAILCNLITFLGILVLGDLAALFWFVALAISLYGIFKLAGGLGYAMIFRIILVILMLVPLVNLATLLILNSRATNALRVAGYKVGLLGAIAPGGN